MIRSTLRKLKIGKEKYFIGVDLEGNSFYERPNPENLEDWKQAKRTVVYAGRAKPLSEYTFHSLPVQWNSWLRRTRRSAPSLDELTIDVQRLASVTANVNRLAIEYKAEKLRGIEPPTAPLGLAAGLRDPALVIREQMELKQQREVIEKEEERRRVEEESLNPTVEKVIEPEAVPVLEPVKLGEDRERTLAKMRRAAEKAAPKVSKGNVGDDYQPATSSVAPRRRGK